MPLSCVRAGNRRAVKAETSRDVLMTRLKRGVERLLVQERNRQIEQLEKRGAPVFRWGYTVRKNWQTPWGVLRRVRMPRLRGRREIVLMEKYYPRFATRFRHDEPWQRRCLEYWAAWVFFLEAGCARLGPPPMGT